MSRAISSDAEAVKVAKKIIAAQDRLLTAYRAGTLRAPGTAIDTIKKQKPRFTAWVTRTAGVPGTEGKQESWTAAEVAEIDLAHAYDVFEMDTIVLSLTAKVADLRALIVAVVTDAKESDELTGTIDHDFERGLAAQARNTLALLADGTQTLKENES